MKTLESFKKKNQPKRRVSKLFNFKKQIFYLYQNGYQVEQIIEYLKTQNIKVSKVAIYDFLKKHKDTLHEEVEIQTKIKDDKKVEEPIKSKAYQKYLDKTKED